MKLHFNHDGSILMKLNLKGSKIEKIFSSYTEYLNFINNIALN